MCRRCRGPGPGRAGPAGLGWRGSVTGNTGRGNLAQGLETGVSGRAVVKAPFCSECLLPPRPHSLPGLSPAPPALTTLEMMTSGHPDAPSYSALQGPCHVREHPARAPGGRAWTSSGVSLSPTPHSGGTGPGFWGSLRKKASPYRAGVLCVPPTAPKEPPGRDLWCMAPPQPEGQETGLQAGTPLLTSPRGPFPGAGALQVLHVACRQVVCGLRPSWTQQPRRGWQDWVPGALCLLHQRHAGLPAPITFTASPGEEGPGEAA